MAGVIWAGLTTIIITTIIRQINGDQIKTIGNINFTCPDGWRFVDSTCYLPVSSVMEFQDAADTCLRYLSSFAVVGDEIENQALVNMTDTLTWESFWNGEKVKDKCKGYWDNNQPPSDVGEEDCAAIDKNGRWRVVPCQSRLPFFCMKPACIEGTFDCGNGNCLSNNWLCDGVNDCGNNLDEMNCNSRCTEVRQSVSGNINFRDYPNSADCAWTIVSPPGSQLALMFTQVRLEETTDYIEVRNGGMTLQTSSVIKTLYGNHDNTIVYTKNNMAILRFISDFSNTNTGFELSWTSDEPELSSDVNEVAAEADWTSLTSPFYPNTPPSGFRREWMVTSDSVVSVQIDPPDLSPEWSLVIYDGEGYDDVILMAEKASDLISPAVYISTSNKIRIILKGKDTSGGGQGIRINVKKGCSLDIQTSSGLVESPGYKKTKYPTDTTCSWVIRAPAETNRGLKLNFIDFKLQDDGRDKVQVYDGLDSSGSPLHSNEGFEGDLTTSPPTVRGGNSLFVVFTSSVILNNGRFKFEFSVDCSTIHESPMLSISTNDTSYGSEVDVTCDTGFTFPQEELNQIATVTFTCMKGGNWDKPRYPTCQVVYCGAPPPIEFGFVSNYSGNATYGSTASYKCYDGFQLEGKQDVECVDNGNWTARPSCSSSVCGDPPTVEHATRSLAAGRDEISYGAIVNYTCNDGYEILGPPRTLCQRNTTWSQPIPVCVEKLCPLPVIAHSQALSETAPVKFGVSITVTCLDGYRASINNSTTASITCRSDQKFDSLICSDSNECENDPCKTSETCVNSQGSYTCMCNEGYRSENCDDINECSDGVSGCDHMCTNTEGSYICSCRPGYTLFVNGSSGIHIKQGETGERSGDAYRVNHTCVKNTCRRPSPIMNGTIHSQRETFMFQDNITYSCNLGYILMGSVTRQCQADGSWSGSDPVCKAATCSAQTPQGTEDQKKQIRGIYPRSDVNFGHQVIVECFNTDGTTSNKTRFCAYDASSQSYTLQGDSPVCPVVDCGEVENIAGLRRPTLDSTVFGARFIFDCEVGATVTGLSANNDYIVTCQQNGRWGYGNLTCSAAKCPDPGSPGGTTQDFASFELGQVVKYSCERSGFTPKPAAILTCIYNESSSSAHWDYPAPTCVDTTSPLFVNGDTQTIWLNSMDAPLISPSADDNSGLIVSMTIAWPVGFDPSNPVTRNTTVDYSAVDGYGNIARLQYIIAVRENIPSNLTCPKSIQLEANPTSPSYNIMDFVTYSSGQIVTDLQITASLDKVGSVTYERMTLQTDRGTEATCAFTVEIVAKACYHQLTNQPENGRLSPSSGSTGDIFTVAECNNGYTFADGSTSRNYTCSWGDKWTPALPIEDCLPYQTPGYSFHISVSLDSTEALFADSPCVENFSQLYNASLASKINQRCPRSGLTLNDHYHLTATDINFNRVSLHLHHVTVTLRVDNNDGNNESLQTCAGNLRSQKQTLFGLNASCVLNVRSESVGVEDSKSGESCEEGYSLKTVHARTQCLPCPKGTYYFVNNSSCVQCPDGQYQDMTGQSSCKRCGQNQVSRAPRTRNDTCEDKCMNGFISSTGSPPCKPCPVDAYWQSHDKCEICPDGGSTLNVQGATSSSLCRAPCIAGKYSKTGYEPCTSCPRNFYQSLTAQTFCHECGLNETTDQIETSSASDCKEGNSSSCREACSAQGTERREFLFHRCVCFCKKGYTGARCDSTIDFCLSSPCLNGATCTSTPEGFSCQCQADSECNMELNSLRFESIAPTRDRYFKNESEESCKSRCRSMDVCVAAAFDTGGATCLVLTADEDRTAKRGNSGTSQDLAKYFDKNCTYQFYYDGEYCENDLRNDCETNNCSKYGVCRDRIGYFECVCPSSGQYIEPSCDRMTNLCAEYPCENGGSCTEWGDIRHQCTCTRGYRGDRCQIEIDECEVNPSGCLYGGQCVDGVDGYTCTCPNSEGRHCQMVSSLCPANVCNNGLCINNYDTMSAECVCERPYENDTHSQCRRMDFCTSNPCNDTSTQRCDSLSHGYRCVCQPGFEGSLCQHNIDDCNNNPCVHGTCVDGVNTYSCNCDPGWAGGTCESNIDDCEGQCSSSSTERCEDLVQDYNCICRSGYTGKNCTTEVNECDSLPCQHGGVCVDEINGFTCNCTAGWEGSTCQTQKDSCGEISCLNDGQCFNLYKTYFCSCQTGTEGVLCEESPNVCSLIDPCTSRGTCQQSGEAATCNCTDNPDYTGVSCELVKDSCRIPGEACQNGGQCVLTDPTGYTCQCSTGFSGSRCEIVDDVCDGKCPTGIECVKEGQMTYCLCPPTQVLAGSVCKDASSNFDLFLDGGLQSESVPSLPFRLSGDLTILFWVGYLRGTRSVYISDNEDDVQYFEMFEDLIKFASESDSFNATLEDKNLLTIRGQWDHVAVTWMSNGTYVVFVNGLRSSEGNFGFGISSTSMKRVRLDSSFTGYVSQITLWRSILTRSDIISVMANSSFSPTGNLALGWTSGYKMTTGSRKYTPSSASQGKKLCDTNRVLSDACDESRAINKSAPKFQSCPLGNIHNVSDQRVVEASTVIPKPSVASGLQLLSTLTDDVLSWGRYDIVYITKDEAGNYGFCRFKVYIKERYICSTSEFPQQKKCGREAFSDFCPSGSEPSVAFPNILRCGLRGSFNLNSPLEPFVPPVCGETTDLRFALKVTLTYTASSLCTPFISRAIESEVVVKIINNLTPYWPDLCPGTCRDVIQRSRCDGNNVIVDLEFTNLPDSLRKSDGSISLRADEIFFTTVKEGTDLDITDLVLRRNDVKVVLLPSCSEAVGQKKCVACGPGSYFDSSSGTCAYCPVGTYTETSSETSCTPCQEGLTTLRQGSNSAAECVTMCQAGTFYEVNSCEYCPVGFYQAEKGKSCPPKKITSGNGTIATDKCFDDCPSGTELQDDASCKECPQGNYRTQSIDVKCQACSGGNTTEGPGTTSASGCNLPDCGPGHYINEARQCVECTEGFYQPIKWQRKCRKCNESFTTEDKGSQKSSDCRYVCTEGTELSDPDTQTCTECREGTYRDSSLEQRFLPCQNCPDGFTTLSSGSSNITDCNIRICLAGNYRNETDNKCYPCGIGEYQPEDLRTECIMCRTNYTTVEEGSVNETQCQFFCPDGYEISSAEDETCSVCPRGTYHSRGDGLFTNCQTCTDSRTTEMVGSKESSDCNLKVCTSGQVYNRSQDECSDCPLDTYQPEPLPNSKTTCLACKPGKGTKGKKTSSESECQNICPSGQQYNSSSNQCEDCPQGTWKDGTLLPRFDQCTDCANENYTTSGPGAVSNNNCTVRNCEAGYQIVGDMCVPCGQGFYQSKRAQDTCFQCGQGMKTSSDTSKTQDDCTISCDAGEQGQNASCSPCPADTYKNTSGFDTCQQCTGSFTSDTNRISCTLTFCDRGVGYEEENAKCVDCSKGFHKDTRGNFNCSPCPKNYTTAGVGAKSFTDCDILFCEPGLYDSGTSVCSPCPLGTYKNSKGPQPCTNCTANRTTASKGATSQTQCSVAYCEAGEYRTDDVTCQKCAMGFYQENRGATDCTSCGINKTTKTEGSTKRSDCLIICGAGRYRSAPDTCTVCDIGQYQPETNKESCLNCSDGFTTQNDASEREQDCVRNCPAGKYRQGETCQPCPVGKYQPITGATTCINCEENMTTRTEGADSERKCVPVCSPGQHLNETSRSCVKCPLGSYMESSGTELTCTPCPTDKNTQITGATSPSDCNRDDCRPGYSINLASGGCRACGQGYFQPLKSQTSCQKCVAKRTTRLGVTTATSVGQCILDCADGYERNLRNTEECIKCPNGRYRNRTLSDSCTFCPRGQTTVKEGATSCVDFAPEVATAPRLITLTVVVTFQLESCNGLNTELLKKRFIDRILSLVIRQALRFPNLCVTGCTNIEIIAIRLHCESSRRRRGTAGGTETATVEVVARDVLPQIADVNNTIIRSTESLLEEVLGDDSVLTDNLKTSFGVSYETITSITSTSSGCVPGAVEDDADDQTSECVWCSKGTRHSATSFTCEACPIGQYQDDLGQTSCKQCPGKLTTKNTNSQSKQDCVSVCTVNPNYCQNNGICRNDSAEELWCQCAEKYTGDKCEIRLEEDSLALPVIIGISVGIGILVTAAVLIMIYCCSKHATQQKAKSSTEAAYEAHVYDYVTPLPTRPRSFQTSVMDSVEYDDAIAHDYETLPDLRETNRYTRLKKYQPNMDGEYPEQETDHQYYNECRM